MRRSRILSPTAAAVEWPLAGPLQPLAFPEIFGRTAPVEVDLGCGDGSFLAAMAERHLERNYLGGERMIGRVRSACRRIAARGLTNARIVRVELLAGVTELLPAASVDVCHLLFPDPWPKRRHHCRRIFTEEFLRRLLSALKPGGVLHLATDDADYFGQMQRVLGGTPGLEEMEELPDWPVTTFEQRFRALGSPVHRVLLRKVSEVM
ncbi:tRNA (guanosine(46)-N7)-methyltransferase TrmB [soil metagenome]